MDMQDFVGKGKNKYCDTCKPLSSDNPDIFRSILFSALQKYREEGEDKRQGNVEVKEQQVKGDQKLGVHLKTAVEQTNSSVTQTDIINTSLESQMRKTDPWIVENIVITSGFFVSLMLSAVFYIL